MVELSDHLPVTIDKDKAVAGRTANLEAKHGIKEPPKRFCTGVLLKPPLTEERILQLADAWFEKHGKYPVVKSGKVSEESAETWNTFDQCLRVGCRGLPG